MKIPIPQILVGERYRRDMGDIAALAESIAAVGLLQPIGITAERELVFGERRLRACEKLGMEEIDAVVVDVPSIVEGEYAENEVRKDFTVSERVAIGRAVEAELGKRQGQRTDQLPQNIAEVPRGESRAIAAKKSGFGNHETYRQAKQVTDKAEPELVEAMDSGVISISAAHRASALPAPMQREVARKGRNAMEEMLEDQKRITEAQPDYLKVQDIVMACKIIADCGMTASEFLQVAPPPAVARCRRYAPQTLRFLQGITVISNDQKRTG